MNVPNNIVQKINRELEALNERDMIIDGQAVKPGSCYYVGLNPLHILYNTNCPDALKKEIENIIAKYMPDAEDNSYQQTGG